MPLPLTRRLGAEAIGTALLVTTVTGSGIMGDALSSDDAVSLLGNTLATGAMLVVLITILGGISGAQFNPAVSLVFLLRGEMTAATCAAYVLAQVLGGLVGTLLAHAMFDLPLWQMGVKVRSGGGQWLAEALATFGLIGTILGGLRFRPDALPWLVGLYITGAYWFTASTSFANPAVALARAFTGTFAGIRLQDVPAFAGAEVLGALAGMLVWGWLFKEERA